MTTEEQGALVPLPQSPLSEADPASLNELFARDPLSLSNQEIDQITTALRAQRAKWAQEEAAVGPKKAGKVANQAVTAKLDLKDLEIDL